LEHLRWSSANLLRHLPDRSARRFECEGLILAPACRGGGPLFVERYGLRRLPELRNYFNPMPYEAAA